MERFHFVLQTTAKIGLGLSFVWCPKGHCPWSLVVFLYINDISTDIDSEIRLFADGCVCYREIKDTKDTSKLQKDIDQLEYWSRKWGMRFPPVKCRMSSKHFKKRSERFVTGNYNFETGSMTGILEHLNGNHSRNRGETVDSYCYTKV